MVVRRIGVFPSIQGGCLVRQATFGRGDSFLKWLQIFILCNLLWGCAAPHINMQQIDEVSVAEESRPERKNSTKKNPLQKGIPEGGWTERVFTEKELMKLVEKDPDLTPAVSMEILARLNSKARYYVPDDIKSKTKMKVPDDFSAFKYWTPLPRDIPVVRKVPKFILVAKDIPFLGWYEKGKLVGDTQICIGKGWEWTKKGLYKIQAKDPHHVSTLYPNAYGEPTPMPLAMLIYGRVWIHVGDVVGGYCSHGCINLPLTPAEKLFNWTKLGTIVLVLDSMEDLDKDLKKLGPEKKKEVQTSKSYNLFKFSMLEERRPSAL